MSIGDTTEDQHSMLSKSAESSVHSDSASHTYDNQIGPELPSVDQMAENIEPGTDFPKGSDMIALKCVAECVPSPLSLNLEAKAPFFAKARCENEVSWAQVHRLI